MQTLKNHTSLKADGYTSIGSKFAITEWIDIIMMYCVHEHGLNKSGGYRDNSCCCCVVVLRPR